MHPLIEDDSPVIRVTAGPGTGKTFGLRKRVLRLLHPDGLGMSPERVLVCAFNRVIADDLREAIAAELKPFGLQSPVVMTVHGLAVSLQERAPRFLLPYEVEAMACDVRLANPTLDAKYGRREDRFEKAIRDLDAGIAVDPALATAIRYWLTDHGAEMVGEVPRKVEARLRGGDFDDQRFDHVIVDEFQDLTELEARLAIGMCNDQGCVVALGDRKQSIYAFRGNEGAGLEALPQYTARPVTDHSMTECQRCPDEVVELANQVMAVYNEPLVPVCGPGALILRVHCGTPGDEARAIACEVVERYRANPEDDHLVLVTRRKWGYEIREAISSLDPDVPTRTVFAEDVLETWPAREAFMFLSMVGVPDDAVSLRAWISYRQPDAAGRNWKPPGRNAAVYQGLRHSGGVLDCQRALHIAAGGEALRGAGKKAVQARLERLAFLLEHIPDTKDPGQMVNYIMDPNRWVNQAWAASDLAAEDIDRLRRECHRLLAEAQCESLAELVERLRYRIAAREPLGEQDPAKVRIVTLWGAKGLTADHVYLTGLCDEALPGKHDPTTSGLTEAEHELEQLRLLYVSLTRARKTLVISRPCKVRRGEVPALMLAATTRGNKFWQDLCTCRLLEDLPASCLPDSVPVDQ